MTRASRLRDSILSVSTISIDQALVKFDTISYYFIFSTKIEDYKKVIEKMSNLTHDFIFYYYLFIFRDFSFFLSFSLYLSVYLFR